LLLHPARTTILIIMCDTNSASFAIAKPTAQLAASTSASGAGGCSSSDPVIVFRLKNGLCHICGTRIYLVADNGRISPLTLHGIVMYGRCLFCYPEPQEEPQPKASPQQRVSKKRKAYYYSEYDEEGTTTMIRRHQLRRKHLQNDGTQQYRNPNEPRRSCTSSGSPGAVHQQQDNLPDDVASSPSVARLPLSVARASQQEIQDDADDDTEDDERQNIDYVSSKSLPADCGRDNDEDPIVGEPENQERLENHDEEDDNNNEQDDDDVGMRVEIRDYQRYLYVGTLLEGTRRKGRGTFRYVYKKGENKGKEAMYEGEFENGRMHGQGTSRDAAGCVYRGTFCRGAAHGLGACTWSEQWRYEGEWVMDRREGKGTLQQLNVDDGEVYSGEWKQDQWHGAGDLKFAGGGRYVGDFKHHKLDGIGKVRVYVVVFERVVLLLMVTFVAAVLVFNK
jgi:hypothetical protein